MKILVIGATGLTGQHIVKQALQAGHKVTALARDPAKLKLSDENLRIVKGDVPDPDSLQKQLPGKMQYCRHWDINGFSYIPKYFPKEQSR